MLVKDIMPRIIFLLAVLVGMRSYAAADSVKVMFLHNLLERNAGWKAGFNDLFVPFLNSRNGFTMSDGQRYRMDTILCEENLDTNAVAKVQSCVDTAHDEGVDAIVVATSSFNDDVKTAAEGYGIPNLHCSGGNPLSWTLATPHAFGLHLPFQFYSRAPLNQASLLNFSSLVILRDYDWPFVRTSAVSSAEWSRMATLRMVGPTEAWCFRWSNKTRTCGVRSGGGCRCGLQSEFDAFGFKYNVDALPSFYEVSESAVVEDGFDSRAEVLSPALVEFVEGIIEDVRSQGADPDVVVNWLTAARSGLMAMMKQKLRYKMYFGAPHGPGRSWIGYETSWPNGSAAMGFEAATYNVGGGQWHDELRFADPYFDSSKNMASRYLQLFGEKPTYDAAACAAAGVTLARSLEKYGASLLNKTIAERREEIRLSLGRVNDETLFGTIIFSRTNQNQGRSSVNWQVMEDGHTRPVLPVDVAVTSWRSPSPSWDAKQGCPPGSFGVGDLSSSKTATECRLCKAGTFRNISSAPLTFSQCEQCPYGLGTLANESGSTSCHFCPEGRFQNGHSDEGICTACPLGQFRSASTATCEACAVEHFADEPGLSACKPCPAQSEQAQLGQSACECQVGSFKDPADPSEMGATLPCLSCESVLPGSTTLHPNGKSSDDCVCPPGTYWHRPFQGSSVAFCKPCRLGLICNGGIQAPLQARGYSAGAPSYEGGDPTYIVECSSNVRCPEGLPLAGCPGGNYGVACVNCAENHFDDNGLCKSCSDSNFVVWPLIVAILFGLFGLVIVYKFATRVDRSSRDSVATIIIAAGLIVAIFQDLPSFGKVKVKWVQPLKTLRGVLSFLSFDIGVLRPNCWLGPRNTTVSYFYAILAYPCGACTVCAFLAFAKYVLRKDVTLNDAINTNGLLLSAVYMALAALSLRPFKCLENPDGSASLGADRSLLCWQGGDHQLMVALSFLPMLGGVLSYLSLIIWAVTQYPRKVSRPGGVKFVKRWSFAFSRFNPTSYYFILVLVSRDLLIGMTPVILASLNELLFLLWIVTLTSYATVQARLWPWKSQMANLLDSGLTVSLIAFVVLGCMLLDFNVARGTVVIQILSMIAFVLLSTAFVAVIVLVLYRAYKPSKTYGIFLSHHKLGAAVLCRWFKMLLTGIIKDRIFLDSDDVNKLDAIIEVTAWDCENVVVIMTSETLKRMWCAAEIASAHAGEGNVVLVSCDGNGFTDELIQMLPDLWSDEQQATLAAAGISMQAVEEAYNSLSEQKPIPLRRRGAKEQEHFNVAKLVVSQCKGLSPFLLTRLQKTQRQNSGPTGMTSSQLGEIQQSLIMLLGDLDTPESGCSCRVLQALLQGKMHEGVTVVDATKSVRNLPALEAQYEGSRAILVVLTQGVLHDHSFAAALSKCPEKERSKLVPIKADELFVYPDPEFWEKLGQGLIFSKEMLEALQTDFERVRIIYQQLFNVLALKFTSHGSNHIQAAETMVLVGRLLPMIEAPSADSTVDRASAQQRLRTIMSTAEAKSSKVGNPQNSPSAAGASGGNRGAELGRRPTVPLELVFDDSEGDDDYDSSKDVGSTDIGYMKSLEGFEAEFQTLTAKEMEKRMVKEEF
eukprot:s1465_g4.t1